MHLQLLTEEPILAVALLSIASRHMRLNGFGASSRNFFVHDRIYLFLHAMIERLMWAQEQFGGGFTGAGKVKLREPKSGQISWKGSLRTIGTIEALIILSDWHPRGLHFPPNEDDNRLLDIDYSKLEDDDTSMDLDGSGSVQPSNHSAYIEPAWRCDRMSWTMLGLAQSLAFELGLFDRHVPSAKGEATITKQTIRRRRIRLLLSTYIAAHSGRMGIPTTLTPDKWEEDTLIDNMAKASMRAQYDPIDAMQASWAKLVKITHKANDQVFLRDEKRQELRSTGKFTEVIQEIEPELIAWRAEFDRTNGKQFEMIPTACLTSFPVQEPIRTIILLEQYSVRK